MILLRETLGLKGKPTTSVSMNSILGDQCVRYSEVVAQQSILENSPSLTGLDGSAPAHEPSDISLVEDIDQSVDMADCYRVWLENDVDRFILSWNDLKGAPSDQIKAKHFFLTAHNLKGTAGTFGKPTISRLCKSLCQLLKRDHIPDDLALINLHVKACKAAMAHQKGAPEIANAVCKALELQVARTAA